MRVLILGGTGLISVGIVKALLARGADVACFNRGKTPAKDTAPLPHNVRQFHGDRHRAGEMVGVLGGERFDVVIDMCAFDEQASEAAAELTRAVGATQHVFCSTVCTYGVKIPPGVLVDETFPQEPISDYGRSKVACERHLIDCDRRGDFATTIVRPSHTYGEGGPLIDQLEPDPPTWSRMLAGLPVPLTGGGLGLWNSTHRDDVGRVFAAACGAEVAYGEAYNAMTDRVFTWSDYYHEAGEALGLTPQIVPVTADAVLAADPDRFGLLREITRFHGPYTSAKAARDLGVTCDTPFAEGAARTLDHARRTNTLPPAEDETIDALLTSG